jgi:hypothetical protein
LGKRHVTGDATNVGQGRLPFAYYLSSQLPLLNPVNYSRAAIDTARMVAKCAVCGDIEAKLLRCSRCVARVYCGMYILREGRCEGC